MHHQAIAVIRILSLVLAAAVPVHAQTITTFAGTGTAGFGGDGGPAAAAQLSGPQRLSVDRAGNIYFADSENNRIRRIDAATGVITTVAGNGTRGFGGDGGLATAAQLFDPQTVVVDGAGNVIIADTENLRIRRVDAGTGTIATIAGSGTFRPDGSLGDGGPAVDAPLGPLHSVAVDGAGNVFIAATDHCRVRRVDAVSGLITTVAGSVCGNSGGDGGPATAATMSDLFDITLDRDGNLFIVDAFNSHIRRVDANTGIITSVAGTGTQGFGGDGGPASAATLNFPGELSIDSFGNMLIVDGNRIRRIDGASGIITTVAGTGTGGFSGDGGPATAANMFTSGVSFGPGGFYISDSVSNRIRKVALPPGGVPIINHFASAAGGAKFFNPQTVTLDSVGNVYVAETGAHRILRIDIATGAITTVAGSGVAGFSGDGGPATDATLFSPQKVVIDPAGNLFIADTVNGRVRRVDAATRIISTIAGNGGPPFSDVPPFLPNLGDGGPAIDSPLGADVHGLALDAAGNIFIMDSVHCRVRRVDAGTGIITSFAGTTCGYGGDGGPATAAQLSLSFDVVFDASGNLFISQTFSHVVRRVDAQTGIITTVAGTGVAGFSGDGGPASAAQLNFPNDLSVDGLGNLLIADRANCRIRRVDGATGIISTAAGTGTCGLKGDGGPARDALLTASGVAFGPDGASYYIADTGNGQIRKVALADNVFALVGVKSRKQHGAAGVFDLAVDTTQALAGAVTVESRAIGAGHAIVFQFSDAITAVAGAVAVDAGGQPVGTVQTSFNGNELTVLLQNVPDNQRLTVSVTGVNGALDASASLGFLVGDVNNTRSVNSSDISGVKARSGQATGAANFRFDLNASGNINSSDISAVKARSGLSLP